MGLFGNKEKDEKVITTKKGRVMTMHKTDAHGKNQNLEWEIVSNESKEEYKARRREEKDQQKKKK